MSTRASQHPAVVIDREQVGDHLVRIRLDGLHDFVSTRIADEWVGLIVPGQFQSRYYTVREHRDAQLVLDIVVHDEGLVTEWAAGDCVGDQVTITDPKGSFLPPDGAQWLLLVGDLTAMPAISRIVAETSIDDVRIHAELPEDLPGYLPDWPRLSVTRPPSPTGSDLAEVVAGIDWPAGEGYFWMAGESAAMRAIRKHLMRERKLPSTHYDVMGYWRGGGQKRQPRAVDPGPIWREGKAAGKSDEQIWADYDAARDAQEK